jgi:hypothetical protein
MCWEREREKEFIDIQKKQSCTTQREYSRREQKNRTCNMSRDRFIFFFSFLSSSI